MLSIIKLSVGSWNCKAFCFGNWPGLNQVFPLCLLGFPENCFISSTVSLSR